MTAMAYLDPDFRNLPKTETFCVRCQKDMSDATSALRVSVDWDTWDVTLGGDHLMGRDCAKKIGLMEESRR